jgi:hypothetical protein
MVLKDLHHVIGCDVDVFEANTHQRTVVRALYQLQRCPENDRASAFTANQCTRHVEAVFGQQFV